MRNISKMLFFIQIMLMIVMTFACEEDSSPPVVRVGDRVSGPVDGADCRSPLNYCLAPQVCRQGANGFRCYEPAPPSSDSQCSLNSSGLIYPVDPRVHVDTMTLDPLDSANIEPTILNVTAYTEYMAQLLRANAEPLREIEGLAYFLVQEAEESGIPFEVAISLLQREINPEIMSQFWAHIVPEVRGTELTDDPPRVMQRIVRGESQLQICTNAGYTVADCCKVLAWSSALTRDEDIELMDNGSLPSGYSAATTALLDRERDEVERGDSQVVQPFVQLGIKAWLSYCGDEFDGGPSTIEGLKQSFGDYHTDRCAWSQELHPLSAAKKTGRRIYRKDLGLGQKISVAETINKRCEVIETEVILSEGITPMKFWSYDRYDDRVWHAVFLRRPGEDSLRYTPDSCMGCHYTFDQRRFAVVEPSYEALNLKYMILKGEEQWEDAWGCVQNEDYIVTHAAEVIQNPPNMNMMNESTQTEFVGCSELSCGDVRSCDEQSGLCLECRDDSECLVGETCISGGICAQPLTIGGSYEPYLYEILTRALECWDSHYGVEHIEACYELEVIAPLLDTSGSERTSTGRALDVEGAVCDPNGEVSRYFSSYEYAELRRLFGCGPQNAWNLWWEEGFTPAEQLCIFYVPVKSGFITPPYQREEVIVFGACDRSWERN